MGAYGLTKSEYEFPSKTFYYALDNFEFVPFPQLTDELADQIIELNLNKIFTGVPTKLLGDIVQTSPGEMEMRSKDQRKLTEADRLAQVVLEIDFDTAAVPKGAYALDEAHSVVASSDFKGLSTTDAVSVSNYVHFRPPNSVAALRAEARTDIEFYANFLDSLESDLPKGCWSLRQDRATMMVRLRSLSWPGYVAFHVPGTTKFGGVFFGHTYKHRDLPFLL